MDDIIQCGNDLNYLLWLIKHHGDNSISLETIGELASVLQGVVQVLTSSQIRNSALSNEFRAESARYLTTAVNKFATSAVGQAA
jgi:hypothetical protein